MSTYKISGPGPGGGGFAKADHLGHLLAFAGAKEAGREGQNGSYTVAHVEAAICTTCHEAWTDTDVSGAALAPRILSAEGEIVAGILTVGKAKEGRTAPFLLDEPSPDDIDGLEAVFTSFAARMPSGKIVFDVLVYNEGKNPKPALEEPLG
jgi:hypothetical protein